MYFTHMQLTDLQSLRGVLNQPRFVMGCISKAEDGRQVQLGVLLLEASIRWHLKLYLAYDNLQCCHRLQHASALMHALTHALAGALCWRMQVALWSST